MTDTIQKIADEMSNSHKLGGVYMGVAPLHVEQWANRLTALSARASAGEGGEADAKLIDWLRRINDAGSRLAKHLGEGQPHSDMVCTVTGLSALALERLTAAPQPAQAVPAELRSRNDESMSWAATAERIATPKPAQAGDSGGVWAPTCQKCRMTITRPGECAIGGQHCQCSATPASPATGQEEMISVCSAHPVRDPKCPRCNVPTPQPATGDAATREEEIRRHDATPPAHGDGEGDDSAFIDWIVHEMPAGTIIGSPQWWAPRIARAYRQTHHATRPTPEAQEARDVWTTKSPGQPGWYWHDDGDVMVPLFVFKRPGHEYLAVQEDAHPVTGKRSFRMVNRIGGKWSAIHAPLRRRDAALALPAQGEG